MIRFATRIASKWSSCQTTDTFSSFLMQKRFQRTSLSSFNRHFFDNGVVSREHAWLLGFAYGDGCVFTDRGHDSPTRFILQLQYKDIDVLKNVITLLKSDYRIRLSWQASESMRNRPHC